VIDLHLHTTASDGRLPPAALVALAARVGLTIISITDHDTVAGLDEARRAAAAAGIRLVNGIEITAIEDGLDVHVLGYFFDPANSGLDALLRSQQAVRIDRIRAIGARLRALGCTVDVDRIVDASNGRSVGRPALADALVTAGHATDRRDAFDRWLGEHRPAFVPRSGPSLARACEVIVEAGGLSSLAHPGLLHRDDRLPAFAAAGLAALEARHAEHTPELEAYYRERAQALGLAISGGSDFHGDHIDGDANHGAGLGQVTLGSGDFDALEARLTWSRTHLAQRARSDS
jgi:3',5'-nucleoside bisphosphate phosphatase